MAYPDATDHDDALTPHLSRTNSNPNSHLLFLPVPARHTQEEEDRVSRASTCTSFATPEGRTPRSSDGELEEHCAGKLAMEVAVVSSGCGGDGEEKEVKEEMCVLSPAVKVEAGCSGSSCSMCTLSDGASGERESEQTRGLALPPDGGLEVSGGMSVPFHSESQSTLTESKETKRSDIREDNENCGGRVDGGCDETTDVSNEAELTDDNPTPPGHKIPPLSINNTEDHTQISTRLENGGGSSGWTRSSSSSSNNNNSNTDSPVSSCSRYNNLVAASPVSSSTRFIASQNSIELEESYSIGSSSYKFSSSGASCDGMAMGRWVGFGQLKGALYRFKANHATKTSDSLADEESALLCASEVSSLEEGGVGRGVWSRRRNNGLPCPAYDLGVKRDKSSPDVFYSPTTSK